MYGLALVTRGHVEATAVLAYFCDRVDALSKNNIKFEDFEHDVADAVLGAHHKIFSEANPPPNIMNCIEKGDRFIDNVLFTKKTGLLIECYSWLSEFAHPNFCSNKISFSVDKQKHEIVFRHNAELQKLDFELLRHLDLSASVFPLLFDRFGDGIELHLTG